MVKDKDLLAQRDQLIQKLNRELKRCKKALSNCHEKMESDEIKITTLNSELEEYEQEVEELIMLNQGLTDELDALYENDTPLDELFEEFLGTSSSGGGTLH